MNKHLTSDKPIYFEKYINEILLNKYMLENSKDIDDKIYYLYRYIKNIKSTVFRQTMFSEFEERMHSLIEEEVPVNLPVIKEEYRKLLDKHFVGDKKIILRGEEIQTAYTNWSKNSTSKSASP